MRHSQGSIAIDLGASSARFAVGWLEDGEARYEIIAQEPHQPVMAHGQETWNTAKLLDFCNSAIDCAQTRFQKATVGIDTWGVDSGFLDENGDLLHPVVCYRDPSHKKIFDEMAMYRRTLFQLTGIQHQPFNTVYQLAARLRETPDLQKRTKKWLLLPSLLGALLGVDTPNEFTHASTTQLMGLDGKWCEQAFDICGWRPPDEQPQMPGKVLGKLRENVYLVSVGSHDTASAVHGLGGLSDSQAFLNVGTWALLGCILDKPLVNTQVEDAGFSNERAVDGRVRFLCNVAGFYVINRLYEELGIDMPLPDWVESAEIMDEGNLNLLDRVFFNPPSMKDAIIEAIGFTPKSNSQWAGIALSGLVKTNLTQLREMEKLTGRKFTQLRISGGGSQSRAFISLVEKHSNLHITAGPVESTIIGNLRVQLGGSRHL